MHGRGLLKAIFNGRVKSHREGTFKNDMPEGISVRKDLHGIDNTFINEFKEGLCFGKGTIYKRGKIHNCLYKNGKWTSKEITSQP